MWTKTKKMKKKKKDFIQKKKKKKKKERKPEEKENGRGSKEGIRGKKKKSTYVCIGKENKDKR